MGRKNNISGTKNDFSVSINPKCGLDGNVGNREKSWRKYLLSLTIKEKIAHNQGICYELRYDDKKNTHYILKFIDGKYDTSWDEEGFGKEYFWQIWKEIDVDADSLNGTEPITWELYTPDGEFITSYLAKYWRRAKQYAKEYLISHNDIEYIMFQKCYALSGEIIDSDLWYREDLGIEGLAGTKKIATDLTITIFKSSAFKTLSQTFKRRSTTTKPRLVSYTINGLSASANLNQFVDKTKLLNLINDFNINNAYDFINAIGKCFPQQVEREENNKETTYKSKYQLIDFSEFGVKILLRVSNHNINAHNIQDDVSEAYSIVVKNAKSKNTFVNSDEIDIKEYVYFAENCDRHKYLLIAKNIYNLLETSVWDEDFVKADVTNPTHHLDGYTTRDNGTALSENAAEAEREGKFSAGTFRQMYKVAKSDFEMLEKLGILYTREWHHTGKGFKKTDFYEWADHIKRDYTDAQIEDGSFADIYQQNKKKIGDLIRRITEHDFAFDKEESKYGVPDEYTCIYYDFKELLKGTPIIDKYYEEQERISNMSDVYMPYERKEMHEEVDKKYRREYQDLLSKKYHEKWDEQIKFNENVDKINEQIKAKNLKKDCAEIYCIKLCKMFGFDDERSYNCAISYRKSVEIEQQKAEERRKLALAKELYEEDKKVFLDWRSKQIKKGNITYLERVSKKPNELFFLEKTEMQGKYGWFEASSRYNLQEYYSGYSCKNKRVYNEYLKRIPHYKDINTLQGLDGIVEIHYLNDKTKIGVISPYNSAFVSKAHDLNGKWGSFEDKNGVSHKCWIFDISEEKEVKDALFKIYGSTGEKGEITVTLLVKNFSDRNYQSPVTFFGIEVARAFGNNLSAKLGSQIIWLEGLKHGAGSRKNWYTEVSNATFKIKDVPIGLLENEDLKKQIEEGKVEVLEEEPRPQPKYKVGDWFQTDDNLVSYFKVIEPYITDSQVFYKVATYNINLYVINPLTSCKESDLDAFKKLPEQPQPEQPKANKKPLIYFAFHLSQAFKNGESFDWTKAQKFAEQLNIEATQQELMQACELAVVLAARQIAHNGQSIAQRFAALKDLYEQQVTIRPLDTQSKILQQYSTPCPLAFLLGEFILPKDYNGEWGYFLEPSAGNGMLTIALPVNRTVVNEIDNIRHDNLKLQDFHKVCNQDASIERPRKDIFIGVITNPPFGKLKDKDKIERNGWAINTLDYKMAVLALDSMDGDGKAAIIVGGKMWDSYWKPLSDTSDKKVLFGQWKTFLGYLYAQYNVVDVIYVNGDNIYRKQGTQYPIVIILIDGRHQYDESNKPRYVFDNAQDTIIQTYDELFDRLSPYIIEEPTPAPDNDRERRLRLAKARAKAMIMLQEQRNRETTQN